MYRKENKWRLAKWHGSCSLQPRSLLFVKSAWGEVIMENGIKSEYDVHSAVIFFLVGMGIGSVLALVFNPRHRVALEGINSWRRAA
jgi:thiosulfate reductase cytochrome b subunit